MTEPPEAPTAEQPDPGAPAGPPGEADGRKRGPGSAFAARAAAAVPRSVTGRATLAGVLVSALLILAIVSGSRLLRNFDSALLPYAVATVFLAFGVAYRYTVWISAPVPDASSRKAGAACSRPRTSARHPQPCRR